MTAALGTESACRELASKINEPVDKGFPSTRRRLSCQDLHGLIRGCVSQGHIQELSFTVSSCIGAADVNALQELGALEVGHRQELSD